MRDHNGMRPQDIEILLKIILLGDSPWQIRDLASDLGIAVSEVSASLHRSLIAGLLDNTKKKVHRQSFFEFIRYGLRYVFPLIPGSMVTGIPTAHSHPYFAAQFHTDINYVWPAANGTLRGLALQPLHAGVTKAIEKDEQLHTLLASIDIVRIGRKREIDFALEKLRESILH